MADQRTIQLNLLIKEAGAAETAAEIKKIGTSTVTLQSELGKLSRADQLQKIGSDMGVLAKQTGNVSQAVTELTKKLTALGATEDEIRSVASAFNEAQSAGDGAGGGPNLLQRAGTGLRSLPSIGIPGTNIGTDAVANITRLTGALGEAAGVTDAMAAATTALTPLLGATAAGIGGVVAVAGPLIAIVVGLGLALKAFSDQAAEESKQINAIVDGQREAAQKIAEGLTTEDTTKQIDDLNKKRKAEADLLAKNQQVYDENINSLSLYDRDLTKFLSGAEEALSTQITKSTDAIAGYDAQIALLTKATEDGSLAANDAAVSEKKLAEERSKAALNDADAAGKELAAQQKALAATEEQNNKRLTSIDDEKAVVQAQIDVLTESGITSEEVTKKLESLNGQLGALGDESDFIKKTALAVSKQRDADKKAQKDAEDAAKKAEQAQTQYTKAIDSSTRTYKNAVQDLGTRLNNQLTDNATKANRDLVDIATKYKRDEYDLELKANRAERDAQIDQSQDLAHIREASNKDEIAAIQEGDFKALFLARQKAQEDLKAESVSIDRSADRRKQDLADAQQDLLRGSERARTDRVTALERQNTDARLAQQRDLQQAALTRNRAAQLATEARNAELAQLGQFLQTKLGMEKAYQQQSLALASGQNNPNALKTKSPFGAPTSFSAGGIGRIIKK